MARSRAEPSERPNSFRTVPVPKVVSPIDPLDPLDPLDPFDPLDPSQSED